MIQKTFTLTNYTPIPIYPKMQNHIGREETTLEPAPPLRRIYTPSLIKVLLPQNQCKSSFTKSSFLILRILIVCSYPTKTFKQEIKKSCNKFKICIFEQYFFRNNIHGKLPPFKTKSNWIPPPSDNHTLISLFTKVEQELGSISTTSRKAYSNLTLKKIQHGTISKITNPLLSNHAIKVEAFTSWTLKRLPHQNPHTPSRPQYIQTTHRQPHKCNSLWCSYSHTLYAFPKHNRHDHHEISTASQEHTHTCLLWVAKNTSQTALSAWLFQHVMVQLTVSYPILPTSSSL